MSYPLLDVFLTMMWFFLWVLWIYLLVRVITDIFRSRDLGGGGKAGWLAFAIVLPFLGVFVYLIARGGDMADRQAQDEALRTYGHRTQKDSADELAALSSLHDRGVISGADYQRGKEEALSGHTA